MIEETNEIWKDIEGYEGLYMVSNKGNVKSLNYKRTRKEKVLKPCKKPNGYLKIILWKEGKIKNMYIHRLVCDAFLQNPLNLPQVNHINEDKTDNRVENLEYCTAKYNSNYGSHNKKIAKALSMPVICIETGVVYPSASEIQRKFGFSKGHICKCCNGQIKSSYKYHWKWAE